MECETSITPYLTSPKQHLKSLPKHPPKQNLNPLQKAIQEFIATHLPPSLLSHSQHALSLSKLACSLPKRYTIYEPMLLLPFNVFTYPPAWGLLYNSLDNSQRQVLYATITNEFSRFGVTHIAMNAPIILTDPQGLENRMRSPVGLIPLFGDFGPTVFEGDSESENGSAQPSEADYKGAFWVSTVQNHGIVQIWAPVYTMFSRGNITEKARILGHGASGFEGLDEGIGDVAVVDMYAGIGYFAFSYLKRGVKRVWGWEINGWSVEGLRRGCVENGWGCKVVRVQSDGKLSVRVSEFVDALFDTDRVVIFHGDNRFAADVMGEVQGFMESRRCWTSIKHVNLGLLPSSSSSWDNACKIIDKRKGGWVHVHENVNVEDIEEKRGEIAAKLERLWNRSVSRTPIIKPSAECRHVEQVKTYAPGVMHCVFDLKLSTSHDKSESNIS
ncbi:S-adenosyl-L-methionine-dependent methyltransferase [Aspergillus cavernicola]|uniref:tRNA wybutosine-synthesizing protein 2 n=1 Tax=Aspergillus cavernicola TaxID=176166 RepID=A0ABR4IQI3_9EURO